MNKQQRNIIISALVLSMVQMGANSIAPILPFLAEAFPNCTSFEIQFVMTLPSAFIVIFCLLASVIEKKTTKKTRAVLGELLIAANSICVVLFHSSIWMVYCWVSLIGCGIGLVIPVALSLISDDVDIQYRPKVMGLQSSFANLGNLIMTTLCSLFSAGGWHFGYLAYLIGLLGVVCSIVFLSEEKNTAEKEINSSNSSWIDFIKWIIVVFLATMLFTVLPTNMAMLMQQKGIEDIYISGAASNCIIIGGMIAGITYGKVAQHLKRNVIYLGILCYIIGILICINSNEVIVIMLGCFIGGMCLSYIMPQAMIEISGFKMKGISSSAIIMASSNLGGFCSPILTVIASRIFSTDLACHRMLLGVIVSVMLSLAFLLTNRFSKKANIKKV